MRAVVVGAAGGIGAALVDALREEGTEVHAFARSLDGAGRLDLTDEESIAAAAVRVPPGVDLVFVATGLLHQGERGPEKTWRDLDGEWLQRNFLVNAIGPALVAKHFLPLLPRDRRGVFAALSARVGSISDNKLGGWYGYRASKAALNQLIRTLAVEERRRNPGGIVVALHPGTVDTGLSKPFQSAVQPGRLFTPERAAVQLLDVLEGFRPVDSGKLFDWEGKEVGP